ncbi:tetratricopeptide repeat protein [Pragia fontium]|uniref:Tetratricopeptide repeat protein n=1 Tax=Pragia fontium DSM 5563 = ATCC 49100 TaxID=1122977 RepID=A0AAJ4WBL2_9GAMM|nr:tetratricopeptide repeat protein [Pragia fontium]SFD05121.1 hypothetical protein SAMN02745723_10782 [Pragia fontium DSM 5563 = ATCC 49100]VEJ56203.1 Uncharacterised protein [Pragia fontium]
MMYVFNGISIIFALLMVTLSAVYADEQSKEFYDFDGDGINDSIIQSRVNNVLHLSIYMSSINKNLTYEITPPDDNNFPVVHSSYKFDEIEVDSTYYSRQGQVYSQVYKWVPDKKQWLLVSVITGERSDPISGIFTPSLEIERVSCCRKIGENQHSISYKSKSDVKNEINNELKKISDLLKENKSEHAIKSINIYSAAEYVTTINDSNVVLLNDLAFFLAKKDNIASAIILKDIVDQYPSRVVAKLNLADVYWELGKDYNHYDKARTLYKEYKNEMIEKGLNKNIPKRVFLREN